MPAASNVAILPSRPARPTLEIGGERQTTLESALLSMALSDAVDSIARAEFSFGNWGGSDNPGFQHFDRKILEFGKDVVVKLGDEIMFDGRIGAITADFPDGGPPTIGVLAEDRLQDLRMTRRSRGFPDKSLGDIVRQIAGEHGLTADVSLSGPTTKLVAQVNQSDLALLYDLARREDAQIWVEGKTLQGVGDGAAEIVGVIGLTLEDDADGNDGVVFFLGGELADNDGNLECARHLMQSNGGGRSEGPQFFGDVIDQTLHVLGVELAGDDGEAAFAANDAGSWLDHSRHEYG